MKTKRPVTRQERKPYTPAQEERLDANFWLSNQFGHIFPTKHAGIEALQYFLPTITGDVANAIFALTDDEVRQILRRINDMEVCRALSKKKGYWDTPLMGEAHYRKIGRKNARIVHTILVSAFARLTQKTS